MVWGRMVGLRLMISGVVWCGICMQRLETSFIHFLWQMHVFHFFDHSSGIRIIDSNDI